MKREEKALKDIIKDIKPKNTQLRSEGKRTFTIFVSAKYDREGKQIRKTRTVKLHEEIKTAKMIADWLTKQRVLFEEDVKSRTHTDGSKITLTAFIDKWWREYAVVQLSPSSLKNYRMRIDKRIIPAFDGLKLTQITPLNLTEFYNNLREEGIRLDGKFTPTDTLITTLAAYSTQKLVDLTDVSFKTLQRIKRGGIHDRENRRKNMYCS
ncbi:MAG: N-terminal phage integrase SAM-like domain-containing protein [Oscillospiraceae bacterium]|nr:N-terminal phage integrase SAM-like domain-containing protein [Oscillospiraceae bacterium]